MACSRAPGRRKATGRSSRTSGPRAGSPTRPDPNKVIWDLGRVPYDPEDVYISELVACLSEISEGITTGTDTSQANHTPEHTDAMIKGLMDSGRRMVYRLQRQGPTGAPRDPVSNSPARWAIATKGIGRIAKTYFSSQRSAGHARLRRPAGPSVPWRRLYRMAARTIVWRPHQQPQRRRTRTSSSTRRPTRETAPTGPTSRSSTARGGRTVRYAQIGSGTHGYPKDSRVEGVGDLPRPRRPRLDRAAHRDADAARHAAVPGGAQSRHPAQPQPGRRHEHDHRSVFADAEGVLRCSARWPTIWRFREQPRRPAGAATRHVPAGDRDGHHRGGGGQPRARQGRHARHLARKPTSSCSTRATSTRGR